MKAGQSRALIRLSASLASGDRGRLEEAISVCREVADPVAVEEVILQSYLFLGYPTALNAFQLWRRRSGREAPAPAREDWTAWGLRGAEVCETVYGGSYGDLRKNIRALHPDMERWMVVEGYGKVLGRPGLPLRTRELCIAALLGVRQLPRQLYSHLRGALNAGAEVEEVEEAVSVACGFLATEECAGIREIWGEVRRRWKDRRAGDEG